MRRPDALVHLPVSPDAENPGCDAERRANNSDVKEHAAVKKMEKSHAGNYKRQRRAEVCQNGPLVCQDSPINREFIAKDKILALESFIRVFCHVFLFLKSKAGSWATDFRTASAAFIIFISIVFQMDFAA